MQEERRDAVAFTVDGTGDATTIDIAVNGRPLADLAAEVERAYDRSLAGAYGGLSPYVVRSIHHYLGRPRATWFAGSARIVRWRSMATPTRCRGA